MAGRFVAHVGTALGALLTGALLAGCACTTGEACFDEAQRRVAEGPSMTLFSGTSHPREVVDSYERGCSFGHAASCREALAFWTTRSPLSTARASGAADWHMPMGYGQAEIESHVRENLARLVDLEFAAAKAKGTREAWARLAAEFPGTDAACIAMREEDALTKALLSGSAPIETFVREVRDARPGLLVHIERYAATMPLEGVPVPSLVSFGLALRGRDARSPEAKRLLDRADDLVFEGAKRDGGEAALVEYLARYGKLPKAKTSEQISLPHERTFVLTALDDYELQVDGHAGTTLEVLLDGKRVCSKGDFSTARLKCSLERAREGARVDVRVGGSGTGRIETTAREAEARVAHDRLASGEQGLHVDAAYALLEAREVTAIERRGDPKAAIVELDRFVSVRKGSLRDEAGATAARQRLVDAARAAAARAAIDAPTPDLAFAFLTDHPDAPESGAVVDALARLLVEGYDGAEPAAYERFLDRHRAHPAAPKVKTALAKLRLRGPVRRKTR